MLRTSGLALLDLHMEEIVDHPAAVENTDQLIPGSLHADRFSGLLLSLHADAVCRGSSCSSETTEAK